MAMSVPEDDAQLPVRDILRNFNRIREKLLEINAKKGSTASFRAMREEIESVGWNGILAKYHPDVNVDDPAALALFELYRFVYGTMKK
jgi:hypothetical protein